jgi:hypothetical protein
LCEEGSLGIVQHRFHSKLVCCLLRHL